MIEWDNPLVPGLAFAVGYVGTIFAIKGWKAWTEKSGGTRWR